MIVWAILLGTVGVGVMGFMLGHILEGTATRKHFAAFVIGAAIGIPAWGHGWGLWGAL